MGGVPKHQGPLRIPHLNGEFLFVIRYVLEEPGGFAITVDLNGGEPFSLLEVRQLLIDSRKVIHAPGHLHFGPLNDNLTALDVRLR